MSPQEDYPNDPNRGMNTKVYMVAIVVALVILIVVAYFFLAGTASKAVPKANQPHPNSRVTMPLDKAQTQVAA